jgi:hypothetical protein
MDRDSSSVFWHCTRAGCTGSLLDTDGSPPVCTRGVTQANNHTALPPRYNQTLAPADLPLYGAALSARQAEALRLRRAGFL